MTVTVEKARQSRLTLQHNVVATLERNEVCAGNSRGQPSARLERYPCVVAAMHDKGRHLDLRQQRTDFHFAIRQKIARGVLGRA